MLFVKIVAHVSGGYDCSHEKTPYFPLDSTRRTEPYTGAASGRGVLLGCERKEVRNCAYVVCS